MTSVNTPLPPVFTGSHLYYNKNKRPLMVSTNEKKLCVYINICIIIYMRPINHPGLEDYCINELGEVFGKDGVRKIKPFVISRGYYQVGLYVRGVGKKKISVHRLVALTFIPTDDTSLDVDHIDNNKLNNHVSNLQWLSRADNIAKSFKQGRVGSRKGKTMGKNMVFYINNDIEAKLREVQVAGGSMGGLVNEVLRQHFFGTPIKNTPLPDKPQVLNPAVADLIRNGDLKPGTTVKYTGEPSDPDFSANELECCQHPSYPCKHWVWDIETGEGYKNTLSGRYREAD